MKLPIASLVAVSILAASGFAYSQTFHSDEEFYRFIENRQRMAIEEMYARKAAAVMAAEAQVTARKRERQRLMERVDEELERQTVDAINYFRRQRGEPLLECNE